MNAYPIGTDSKGRAVAIAARFAARHGGIFGATGTGKSYSIARLSEQFAVAGVPVCLIDVKGDLSGLARSIQCRFYAPDGGAAGARFSIRADDMGADAMARALGLSDAQSGALDILYAFARDHARPLATLADMQAALGELESRRKALAPRYGHITPASLGVIRRALLRLEEAPCELFGGPSFGLSDMLQPGATIIDARRLYESPALYGAAVLHLLESAWRGLLEIGDAGAPRLAIVIDEAHLAFGELPPALLGRVERIVRLIRSRGASLWFASQSPADIPAPILAQLGHRIQHGLRGATVADMRAMRAAAETLPINPAIDAGAMIGRLGVGQALVSVIGADGTPSPVQVVKITAPRAALAPIDGPDRAPFIPPGAPPQERKSAGSPSNLAPLSLIALIALAWILALHFA